MYLSIKNDSQIRFASIEDRLTVGSAPSNGLVLEAKGIRPLHGQFAIESQKWVFRN